MNAHPTEDHCDDCPPVGYPTDKTRCTECPRRDPPIAAAQTPKSHGNTARIVRAGATVPEICMHNVKLGQGCFCPHCPTARSVGSEALAGLIEEARHLLEESRPANGLDQSEQDAWAQWRADWLEKAEGRS